MTKTGSDDLNATISYGQSAPVQVSQQLGSTTFWHASRLRKVQALLGPGLGAAPTGALLVYMVSLCVCARASVCVDNHVFI